ncbi:ABC transporter ATP-binding protein/permease, partial [Candidatus Woesearchaeota archaeon]|nr:ABC transporter ATP-binding protein/permease [Candidatus Woesearchaeota archaeon]
HAFSTFLVFLSVNVGLISPWVMKIFLDDVLINKRFELFYWILGAFLFLFFFNLIFGFVQEAVNRKLGFKQSMYIKKHWLDHLFNLHVGYFQKKKIGDLQSRVENAESLQSFNSLLINSIFIQGYRSIAILIVSLTLSWKATLFTLGIFPFYLLSEKFFIKKMKKRTKVSMKKGADIGSFMNEVYNSLFLYKLFGKEKRAINKWEGKSKSIYRYNFRTFILQKISFNIRGFLQYVPSFAVLAFGGYQVMIGALTIGTLLVLRSYISQVFASLEYFVGLNRSFQLMMVPIDRALAIIKTKPKVKNIKNPIKFKSVKDNVHFENVFFKYKTDPVLNGVDFKVKKGTRIGVAGPSGEGKSTLASLLMRFFDPSKGIIKIDGIDLKKYDLESIRNGIGIVSQDSILLNMTIAENIAFGKPNAKQKDIEKAARMAEIHDFIMGLPKGYDSRIGEKGSMVSGGQRQRLSIARTMLLDPDILILDEPTSALDPETEKKLQRSLEFVSKNKTSLIIAHRLSTLQNVDRIIFIEGHKILEQGSFMDLMTKKGRFFHYYNSQFRTYENFLSRLSAEIKRTRRYSHKLSVGILELDIENLEPEQAKKILDDAEYAIEQNIKDIYFFGVPPHFKHSLQIVMPDLSKEEAEQYMDELGRLLKYKINKDVNYSVFSNLNEIEKIVK